MRLAIGFIVLLGATLWLLCGALAHDGVHDSWFESLHSPETGISCCNKLDCHPTEAELRAGHWWARAPDNQWLEVPPLRVIHDRGNPVGQPILCAIPNETGWIVLCFVPGALM